MTHRLSMLVFVALAFVACKKGAGDTSKYPGTEDGAKQLLSEIRTSGNARGLTLALRPTTADFQAVFTDDAAAKAEAGYAKLWGDSKVVIAAKPEHTELVISKMTTDELAKWTPEAVLEFPGGYKRVGPKLKPGFTVYRWKYVKPGEQLGMSFDGLIYVNNHWAWFPKPWRALGENGGGGGAGEGGGAGGGESGSGEAAGSAGAGRAGAGSAAAGSSARGW